MRSRSPIRRRASRAFRALVLAATLFLGAAFHEGHHALQPHCDGAAHATEHACGCSAMHAAALVGAAQDAPSPAHFEWIGVASVSPAAPATAAPTLASPRAPPAA